MACGTQLIPAAGSSVPADGSITNAKLAAMAANTVKVNPTNGSAVPSDLAMAASTILARLASGNIVAATPAEVRTLTGEVQTATAAVDGTTLPLTFASPLTDGIYVFDAVILTLSATAVFRFYFDGDTTNANYSIGYVQSLAAGAAGAEMNETAAAISGINTPIVFDGKIYIKGGKVSGFARQVRQQANGRLTLHAMWHTTKTALYSVQFTSDIALKIGAGSFINWRRIS